MEEGWASRIRWVMSGAGSCGSGSGSAVPRTLLVVLLLYSLFSQFTPIEPYLVPYLTKVKHFSNFQVTVDIYPFSVYAQLVFTLLVVPACFYFSHKVVIILGAFGMLLTYIIIWGGKSLIDMKLMQITYGFGMSVRLVFSSYIFLMVPEESYQMMTSYTMTTSLLSFTLASELSQVLAYEETSYSIFLIITLISTGLSFAITFLLPMDHSSSSVSSKITYCCEKNEGWMAILKETWRGRSLQLLSLWWAICYAGFSLVQNYGTNLFDAIDSDSKLNGHILAASQAAGSLGSFSAVYLESYASKNGLLFYVFGSALLSILSLCLGISSKIWVAYIVYVTISGIYQTLACLVSVRCSRLLSNGQYIMLFSLNNFAGLLLETLLQAAVEILRLSIFSQFISFASFFLLATLFSVGFCCVTELKRKTNADLASFSVPLIIDHTNNTHSIENGQDCHAFNE